MTSQFKTIKYVTTDGAAEFMGRSLNNYCRDEGIVPLASCSYTPSQNEAENIVKIVSQGCEVLVDQFGGPKCYWPWAVNAFVKTYEVLPNKQMLGSFRTPYEATFQINVDWKKLIRGIYPFGCKAFLHIPRALRAHTHGCPKAVAVYHMGISRRKKGYVVLTAKHHKIIDGVWDVFIIENCFPLAERRDRLMVAAENGDGITGPIENEAEATSG